VFKKKGVTPPSTDVLLDALSGIDPNHSPLFALLVADSIAEGKDLKQEDRFDFLVSVINEQDRLLDGLASDAREPARNLVALATLTRGLHLENLEQLLAGASQAGVDIGGFNRPPVGWETVFDAASRLTGRRVRGEISGLEPDLLGEAFVLNYCHRDEDGAR